MARVTIALPLPFRVLVLALIALAWLAWLLALPPRPSAWLVAAAGVPLLALGSRFAPRRDGESWRDFVRRTWDLHALAAVLLAALGVQFADTHGITTDGVIYFSQLRSVIFDRDLDVAAEFAFLRQPPRPYHVVPIGPTIVWLPLYLAVAVIDAAGRWLQLWTAPPDPGIGLTLPYVRAALVSSFAIGAAGLVAVHRRLREEFASGVAFAATLLLFAATPLVWYMVYEPSMTHAVSFGFVALFVVAAERWTSTAIAARRAVALGALLGMAFITRPQEALFAVFPAVLLLMAPAPWRERLSAATKLGVWALAGAVLFLIAQAVHSTILISREQFALAGDGGYLNLWQSRWADTLWSSWHGFFSWSPVAYIAAVGTVAYARRRQRWAVAALVIVLLMAWINGATADWAAGWSFGGRRFTSVLVVLAPGLAVVVHALVQRPTVALVIVAAAFVGWHQLLLAQYRSGTLTRSEPVSFAQIVRQQAALATRPPFVYPFAFPANAWFAWRTGLPISRYDLLGPEALVPAIDVAMTAAAERYLLDGWAGQVSDPFGDLQWIEGARAELVLPLDPPENRAMAIDVRARTRLVDPPVAAPVTVLINGERVGRFTPDADRASEFSFAVPPGVLRRGFNRIVFEKPPDSPPVGVYRVAGRQAQSP